MRWWTDWRWEAAWAKSTESEQKSHKVSLWTDLTRLTLWNMSELGLGRSTSSTKKSHNHKLVILNRRFTCRRRLPKSIKLLIQHGRVNMSLRYDDTVQVWADQHQHDHPVWTRHRGTEPQECLFHFSWGLSGRSDQIRDTTSHPNWWHRSFSSDQSAGVFTSPRQRHSLTSLSRRPDRAVTSHVLSLIYEPLNVTSQLKVIMFPVSCSSSFHS